jgi:TPP-dependent pyruvate/acetoin dehydrogenase alpha subunit
MESLSHDHFFKNHIHPTINVAGVDKDVVLALYRNMVRLRRFEETLMREYRVAEEMRCPVHFTIGQEAAPAALSLLLRPDDFLYSHHRCHGYFLSKGAPMKALVAELFGRETGANGGLAGSQEISMPEVNFHSGAILTGASSIAVGTALGFQMRNEPHVAVAGFGEAATEEGIFWEAVNYAALRKLPLVYVCENNLYSMYSALTKRQPVGDISRRVEAFGFKTTTLFGNDVVACHRALNEAIQDARERRGPCFVELFTYRWNAHVGPESDDKFGYRPQKELEYWKKNCPISLLERQLKAEQWLQAAQQEEMLREIDCEIEDALTFARNSAFPQVANLAELNCSSRSPLAEALLVTSICGEFNENQADALLAPY